MIDVGLQSKYTGFILLVAIFLSAVLGYQIYEATQDTTKIIQMAGLVDPSIAAELAEEFNRNDRVVLLSIIGFGVILVMSTGGAGIWITHKVAGPLFNMSTMCAKIRDGKLGPNLRALRKGDELQDFFLVFRDMHEALRLRLAEDVTALAALEAAIAANPSAGANPTVQNALNELKALRERKEQSLVS